MRFLTLALLATGCASADVEPGPALAPEKSPAPVVHPKADNANEAPAERELTDEEWLCQDAMVADGACFDFCMELDPDCAGETDRCAANGYYGDGVCDRRCAQPDPDCAEEPEEAQVDTCWEEERYADGACDADCLHPDPDCSDEAAPDVLADWEARLCGRFASGEDRAMAVSLATSLCIEREGADAVDCIAACMAAYDR